jgi:hypothetical protein
VLARFFDPPWITPASPTASDVVSVNIRGGICDSIFFKQGFSQITQQGHSIRILEYGHHWDDLDLCIYDVGTLGEPIGTFAPGDYTLTVDFVYQDYPVGIRRLPSVSFRSPLQASHRRPAVPAWTTFGRLASLVVICGSALWALRLRRRSAQRVPRTTNVTGS